MEKRVAILCSGKSFLDTWRYSNAHYWDTIIAVNTVAWRMPCDYMVAVDTHALDPVLARGRNELCGPQCIASHEDRRKDILKAGFAYLEIFNEVPGMGTIWFSFPNAMRLAWQLGATSVDVFGWDMSPTNGLEGGGDHTPGRWKAECIALQRFWKPGLVTSYGNAPKEAIEWLEGRRFGEFDKRWLTSHWQKLGPTYGNPELGKQAVEDIEKRFNDLRDSGLLYQLPGPEQA